MATLARSQLAEKVIEAIGECSWNIQYIHDKPPINNSLFKIKIYQGNEYYKLIIYIKNLTHGGGQRDQREFRVQMHQHPPQEIGWKTLILGWSQEYEVFAGFDHSKHQSPGRSTSIQIKADALERAYLYGIAAYDKGNNEIAIAFKPDFFTSYVADLEKLHDLGDTPEDTSILNQITETIDQSRTVNDEIIEQISVPRQKIIRTVTRKIRDNSFKRRVLTAYNYQCAFCGLQLNLVDAAHIIPVSDEHSNDETSNGVALCTLHHRAYDSSLITFDEQYHIISNQAHLRKFTEIRRDGGLENFLKNLREIMRLPPDIRDRPHIEYVTTANSLRGWSEI